MAERRKQERRVNPAVPEPLERHRQRRQGERRESMRRETTLKVADGDRISVVRGEVGLGGASFSLRRPPNAKRLTVTLLAGPHRTLQLSGVVTKEETDLRHVHLRFDTLDVKTELELAKWLDGVDDG